MVIDKRSEQKVLENLNKFISATRGRTQAGIMAALLLVQESAISRTPLDTGNLRGSFYKKPLVTTSDKPAGEIGNTAEYAIHVHENLDSRHPIGESKFLEKAILDNTGAILDIIVSRIKV